MTVTLTRTDVFDTHRGHPCTCCGEPVRPPYMVWRAETDIVICEDCAGNIKDGFCADLIHLAALRQLRDFIRPESP